jgi:hypothetical protein
MHIVIFLAFAGTGIWLLYSERELLRLGFASYRWKRTDGTIIDYSDDSFTIPGIVNITGVGVVRYQETAYTYQYVVDRHHYHSKTYCFGGWAEKAEALYHKHEQIQVYYDPKHPEIAVLRRGVQIGPLLGLFPIGGAILYAFLVF